MAGELRRCKGGRGKVRKGGEVGGSERIGGVEGSRRGGIEKK